MRLSRHDKPIGQAKASQRFAEESNPQYPEEQQRTTNQRRSANSRHRRLCELADEFGINPQSIYSYRWRHPEADSWTDRQVAIHVSENKQSGSRGNQRGRVVMSIKDICAMVGADYHKVRNARQRGKTFRQALGLE